MEMDLFERGFLGAEGEQTLQQILQEHAEVFTLLRDINELCHEYRKKIKDNLDNGPHVFAATYFIRSLVCFQSVVILAERGFVEDVRVQCRTLLQIRFRLAAIARDPTVVNRLLATAQSNRQKRAQWYQAGTLKAPAMMSTVDWNAKLAEMGAEFESFGRSEATDKELMILGGCLSDHPAYLTLSDAAHASPADLEDFLRYDQEGKFIGFRYGPHDRQLSGFVLYAATLQLENLSDADTTIKAGLPFRFNDLRQHIDQLTSQQV